MKVFAIYFAFLFAGTISAFADRMCGPKLAEIMWAVCENGFNEMFASRSERSAPSIKTEIAPPPPASSLSSVFQVEAGNLMAKTRRTRMLRIADECCKKSCTMSEIISYCI